MRLKWFPSAYLINYSFIYLEKWKKKQMINNSNILCTNNIRNKRILFPFFIYYDLITFADKKIIE